MIDIDDFKEFLLDTFGAGTERKLSDAMQKKIDAVLKYAEDSNAAIWVDTVEVIGARVPVETVETYGLEITVDANGNAVHVTTPHGFHTDGA